MFQGWVRLLFVLVVVRQASSGSSLGTLVGASLGVVGVSPQLWEPEPWEPERRSKSLAFLGRDEGIVDNNSISSDDDEDKDKDAEDGKSDKKAILNVSDKDSPYALIDKYFPERESYFYQNRNKFLTEYRNSGGAEEKFNDIGDLDPSEVRIQQFNMNVSRQVIPNLISLCVLYFINSKTVMKLNHS